MSVFWLAVAAFAIGTEGFVIAGLLPVIAADMQISVAAAGQLVTVYALAYAIGSPILAVAFNNLDRRNVLTLALCCFIVGNLLAVAAPTFPIGHRISRTARPRRRHGHLRHHRRNRGRRSPG